MSDQQPASDPSGTVWDVLFANFSNEDIREILQKGVALSRVVLLLTEQAGGHLELRGGHFAHLRSHMIAEHFCHPAGHAAGDCRDTVDVHPGPAEECISCHERLEAALDAQRTRRH